MFTHAIIVDSVHNKYTHCGSARTRVTMQVILEAVPYLGQIVYFCAIFKARKALVLRSGVFYTSSVCSVLSRAACNEITKIGLELKILRSEAHFLLLKQIIFKHY